MAPIGRLLIACAAVTLAGFPVMARWREPAKGPPKGPAAFDLLCSGVVRDGQQSGDTPFTLHLRIDAANGRFCDDVYCASVVKVDGTDVDYHCKAEKGERCNTDGTASAGPFIAEDEFHVDRASGAFQRTTAGSGGDRAGGAFRKSYSGDCLTKAFTGQDKPAADPAP
jgi:hypothetical protein